MKNKKTLIYILLGLPLIIYPFILLANVMSAAGFPSKTSEFKLLVVNGFLWTSSFYPISYILSLLPFIRRRKYGFLLPLIHIIIVIVFFILWTYLG